MTAKILTGGNYRLFFEDATRRTLIETYRELAKLAKIYPKDDEKWRAQLRKMVETGNMEDRRMRQWLIGLTKKTATNLGIQESDYPSVFDDVMSSIEKASRPQEKREMALLLWCGTATLTIRGSRKAKIGKLLERAVAGAALTVIGLREAEDYRLNVGADREVGRETDAEVKTPRGWIRIEVGLIGKGNSEVINDKVGRMNRHGIILMDMIPENSTAYNTAHDRGVRLIQIRNNHPVEEMRQHLVQLCKRVQKDPISPQEVKQRVLNLPLSAFQKDKE